MKGKATLILTDKYTNKPVKQITEHNIVTKALEKAIYPPPITKLTMGTSNFAGNFFPIRDKLAGGIVLLGNTLPENAENFMVPPDIIPVGAAGQGYTGTNPYRGTFNASVSGPIENGYRMVWDFAPEKANGVIKCIGLTNFCYGNAAFTTTNEQNCGISTIPINMGYNNASAPVLTSVQGRFYGKTDGVYLYSYKYNSNLVTLIKSEISDPRNIKFNDTIEDFKTAKVVSEKEITLPSSLSTNSPFFYSNENKCFYLLTYTSSAGPVYHFALYKIDPEAGELLGTSTFDLSEERSFTSFSFAVKNNTVFLTGSGDNATMFVLNPANGAVLRRRAFNRSGTFYMFESNGYIMGTATLSGYYYMFYAEYDNYPFLYSGSLYEATSDITQMPYLLRYAPDSTRTNIQLVFRTDYLVTINNLSTPLEKTDRHALQIRYELTY